MQLETASFFLQRHDLSGDNKGGQIIRGAAPMSALFNRPQRRITFEIRRWPSPLSC